MDADLQLRMRSDELSPHQRALLAVHRFWATIAPIASIGAGLTVATILARVTNASIHPLYFAAVYFGVAMPLTAVAWIGQEKLHGVLARRMLAKLDPAGAISALSPVSIRVAGVVPRLPPPATTDVPEDEWDTE